MSELRYLVGEQNPYGSDPRYALFYAPEGSAGQRLCDLVLGTIGRARVAIIKFLPELAPLIGRYDAEGNLIRVAEVSKMAERKERLAISLIDLDHVDSELRTKYLSGRVNLTEAIRVGTDRVDEIPAVVFTCNLLEAALICDLLRSYNRKTDTPLINIYINREVSWSRIINSTVLTVLLASGKAVLNPAVFPDAIVEGTARRPVKLGSR